MYSYISLVEYFVDCFVDYFEYFSYVVHTSLEYTHSLRNTVYLPRNTLYHWLSYMMSYSHYSYSCPPLPSASSSVSADACDESSAGSWPWVYWVDRFLRFVHVLVRDE